MLITAGIVVLADVVTTLLWREPLSSLYASVRQGDASSALAKLERRYRAGGDRTAAPPARVTAHGVAVLARRFGNQATDGQAIGRLVIPTIGLNIVFVQGTDAADLEQGPGHYPSTPLPGQPGTTALAGHRTTYLAPFRDLGSLSPGDPVKIEMPYATLEYRVERTKVVQPTDLGILHRVSHQRLVLTACHPLYSAAERIVAFARLDWIRSTLNDRAERPPAG
jgi:sortase A